MRRLIVHSGVLLALAALAFPVVIAEEPKQSLGAQEGLGRTAKEAIEVCTPPGVHAYLRELRCPNGKAPKFKRLGQAGSRNQPKGGDESDLMLEQILHKAQPPSPNKDFHIVDEYLVKCKGTKHHLYFDSYHCPGSSIEVAPVGFTLAQE